MIRSREGRQRGRGLFSSSMFTHALVVPNAVRLQVCVLVTVVTASSAATPRGSNAGWTQRLSSTSTASTVIAGEARSSSIPGSILSSVDGREVVWQQSDLSIGATFQHADVPQANLAKEDLLTKQRGCGQVRAAPLQEAQPHNSGLASLTGQIQESYNGSRAPSTNLNMFTHIHEERVRKIGVRRSRAGQLGQYYDSGSTTSFNGRKDGRLLISYCKTRFLFWGDFYLIV